MSGILTSDEIAFLEKMENEKKLHASAQKNYRKRKSEKDPQYKTKLNEYMKKYNEKRQNKYALIKKKLLNEAPPKTVLIPSANEIINTNQGNKRGRKQAVEIIPSYQTRKRELKPRTIKTYLSTANIIHRLFKGHDLSPELKNELMKLMNNDDDIDEKYIIDNMDYLNDITSTIETLRTEYYNDSSFKTYLNVLVVITSHLPSLKDNYQILTKLNINVNNAIQDKRDENKLEDYEKDKIIDLDRNVILKNLNLLENIKDKLLFAVYTLQPARRLDWRDVVLTTETDDKELEDDELNFLSISPKGKKVIFNNYKTDIKYGQQTFKLTDPELNKLIDTYIKIKKLRAGNYLFSLETDKKRPIAQSNFSKKIEQVFYKVYKEPISVRFLRMSWISALMKTNPTNKEMKELAKEMAHSKDEQSRYNKILRN
jgi:hypothetical protein